jgi:hypothetical protein
MSRAWIANGSEDSAFRETVIAMAAITLMAAGVYGFLWAPGKTLYSPHSDFVALHLSTKAALYDSVHQGRGIPFWRSDQFSGYEALTNPQALYTHPLHVLFYFIPPLQAVGGTFWLHFLAAGVAYYIVGWSLQLRCWARLLMAAAGMFSFKLIIATYAGWLSVVPSIVSFPLLFAAGFSLARRPGLGAALALAAAGAFCLHSGQIQLIYYAALFLVAYLVAQGIDWARTGQARRIGPTAGWIAMAGMLAATLTAYLLLPLAAEAPLVSRSQSSYEFFLANHAISPRHLLTFVYPEALGTPLDGSYGGHELWEDVGYFGLIPLALAGLGLKLGWRRHPTRYLGIFFVVSVLLATNTPLLRALYEFLPGFKLFRNPGRFLFLTAFFGTALAGIGMDELAGRIEARSPRRWVVAALMAVLIALMAVEGGYYARRYLTMVSFDRALPPTSYQEILARDNSLHRVATLGRPTVNYGWATPLGLQLISGFDAFNYRPYQTLVELLNWGQVVRGATLGPWCDLDGIARDDILDILNVKYLLSTRPMEPFLGHFKQIVVLTGQPVFVFYKGMARTNIFVYMNTQSRERAFWVDRIVPARSEEQMLQLMELLDLRHTALVLTSDPAPPASIASADDEIGIGEAWPGHLSLNTRNGAERFVLVSEVWHPGWRAALDGRPLKLYRTDYALMGAWIPPGRHRLEINFRPLLWPMALWISGASGVVFLGLLAAHMVRERHRRRTNAMAESR